MSRKKKKQDRKKKMSKLEIDSLAEMSRRMNDQCPHLLGTRNAEQCWVAEYEWKCFGKYKECIRYQTGDLTLPVAVYDDLMGDYQSWYKKKA